MGGRVLRAVSGGVDLSWRFARGLFWASSDIRDGHSRFCLGFCRLRRGLEHSFAHHCQEYSRRGLHCLCPAVLRLSVRLSTRRIVVKQSARGRGSRRSPPRSGRFLGAGWLSMLPGGGHSSLISLFRRRGLPFRFGGFLRAVAPGGGELIVLERGV